MQRRSPTDARHVTWCAIRASSSSSTWGARRRRSSAPYSSTPFSIRKKAADSAEAKTGAQPGLEEQPEQARGDRPDDEQPAELGVGVVGGDAAIAERAAEPLEDANPVVPEEDEQDDRGREMGGDEERDEVLVVLVDVPAEQLRENHAVTEARDREELRDALQQPQHDRLRVGDQCGEDHGVAERRPLRAAAEPGEHEAAETQDERSDSVLHVMVPRACLMARKEPGQATSPARRST